jgi:hypothetical protein
MRFSWIFASIFLLFILLSIASAEIKIKVVDPQDAVVAGAWKGRAGRRPEHVCRRLGDFS